MISPKNIFIVTTISTSFLFGGIFSFRCDPGGLFSLVDKGETMCSAADDFMDVFKKNINIGGCSIQFGGGSTCFMDNVKDICKKSTKQAEEYILSPVQSSINSISDFDFLKGDGFRVKDPCAALGFSRNKNSKEKKSYEKENPSGMTDKEIYEETKYEDMKKFGYSPFSSRIETIRDCMRSSGEDCIDKKGFIKLPKDNVATEKEITRAANIIANASDISGANQPSISTETKQKLADCLKLSGEEARECKKKILYDTDTSPQAGATRAVARFEMATAMERKMMKVGSRGSSYYIYKNKDFIEKLPIEYRQKYAYGVARQNVADSLIAGLYKDITELQKRVIRTQYSNAADSSEAYDPGASVDGLSIRLGLKDNNGTTAANSGTGGYDGTETSTVK